jgi:hypothetical protein
MTSKRSAVLGEYMVNLSKLEQTSLAEIMGGDLSEPVTLSRIQEKLWNFLKAKKALHPGHKTGSEKSAEGSKHPAAS